MAYLTPDEARQQGVTWEPRAGEPADLRDPFHYQTPDEARSTGSAWSTQPAIMQGRAVHAGFPGGRPGIDPGLYELAARGGLSGIGHTGMSQSRGIVLPPSRPSTMPTAPPLTTATGGRAIRDVNHPQYWSRGNQQMLYFETGGREGTLGGIVATQPRGDATGGLYQLAARHGRR